MHALLSLTFKKYILSALTSVGCSTVEFSDRFGTLCGVRFPMRLCADGQWSVSRAARRVFVRGTFRYILESSPVAYLCQGSEASFYSQLL